MEPMPLQASPGRVGDFRLVQQALNAVPINPAYPQAQLTNDAGIMPGYPVPNVPIPPLPLGYDQWMGPTPVQLASVAMPQANTSLWGRFVTWLKHFFQPTPPGPIPPTPPYPPVPPPPPSPPPIDPPVPIPPAPGPVAPSGFQVFFTNTYKGTNSGESNSQVNAENRATASADINNPDRRLTALIDGVPAGGTLHGAFFDINVPDVVDALIRAQQRGVQVQLVTEHDYFATSKSDPTLRPAIQRLLAAGISVIPDDNAGGLMHDKFLIVNGQTVWTGSYNITENGSYGDNNNALQIESSELARIYEHEFERMFYERNFRADVGLTDHTVPRTVMVGNAQVTAYFSPSANELVGAKQAILRELQNARKVEFMAFSFTDTDIGQAMQAVVDRGGTVAGVFEKSQAASRYSVYNQMRINALMSNGRLDVRIDTNPALMHHKVIIVDDSTLITGSYNFSKNAQLDNEENMLVIKNAPELVAKYRAEFQRMQGLSVSN